MWFLMSGKDSSWDSTVQTGTVEAYYAYVQKNSGIQDEEVQNHITEACWNMLELSSGNMDNLKLLSEVGTGEIADKAYSQLVNLACDSLAAVSARLANMVGNFDEVISQMNSYYEITDAALSDNRGTLNEREKKHIRQVQSDAVSTVDVQLSSQLRAHKIAEDDLLLEAKANIKALVAYKGLPVATVEDANNQLSQK